MRAAGSGSARVTTRLAMSSPAAGYVAGIAGAAAVAPPGTKIVAATSPMMTLVMTCRHCMADVNIGRAAAEFPGLLAREDWRR
jgi:hypothetical protein